MLWAGIHLRPNSSLQSSCCCFARNRSFSDLTSFIIRTHDFPCLPPSLPHFLPPLLSPFVSLPGKHTKNGKSNCGLSLAIRELKNDWRRLETITDPLCNLTKLILGRVKSVLDGFRWKKINQRTYHSHTTIAR